MEWLRSTLQRWRVQVSFVAGALVVAPAYGTCTVSPEVAEEVSEVTTETVVEPPSVEVSTSETVDVEAPAEATSTETTTTEATETE